MLIQSNDRLNKRDLEWKSVCRIRHKNTANLAVKALICILANRMESEVRKVSLWAVFRQKKNHTKLCGWNV
jgi:hypothetical protein